MLESDKDYYKRVSDNAKEISRNSYHVNVDKWKKHMYDIISN